MNAFEPDHTPPAGTPGPGVPHLHWYRFPESGWLTGVCAGVAYYTRVPVEIVRLAFFLGTLFGWGLIIYVALVILMPKPPKEGPRKDE
jgi:phage shock protein PspC (stress-responsive transcriptional regulator)